MNRRPHEYGFQLKSMGCKNEEMHISTSQLTLDMDSEMKTARVHSMIVF